MMKELEDLFTHREMAVPDFSDRDVASMPNIFQLVDMIKEKEEQLLDSDDGWRGFSSTFPGMPPMIACNSLNIKERVYINDAEPDKFIVNRLGSGRYNLKPNMNTHRFIFRGQKKHFPTIRSSADRGGKYRFLLSNVQAEDFMLLLRTHPLFMMFDRGIYLPGMNKPLFLEMNYYGLAQHYNFNTGLVDFTTDISAAAFFAVTKNLGADKYEPYGGTADNPVGVIYVHAVEPNMTFNFCGYCSIGQQIYPRTAAQHGLFYQEGITRVPVEKTVTPLYCRHDIECAKKIFVMMDHGKRLFPDDDLSVVANDILQSKEVTGEAMARNNYVNQDNLQENIKILQENGITVNWHKRRFFTPEMLTSYYSDVKEKLWPTFCNNIDFLDDKNGEQLMKALKNLPNNPYYKQYFDGRYFNLLQYHAMNDSWRAERNAALMKARKLEQS